MDQRDSYCPYLLSSELTAKGTGLGMTAGKEDPQLKGGDSGVEIMIVSITPASPLLTKRYERQRATQPGTREAFM